MKDTLSILRVCVYARLRPVCGDSSWEDVWCVSMNRGGVCVSVCACVVSVGSTGKRFQTTEQDQSESAQARRFTSPSPYTDGHKHIHFHTCIQSHPDFPTGETERTVMPSLNGTHTLKPVPLCQCRPRHHRLILRTINIPYVHVYTK